jgi:hypothetical protein
MQSKSYTHTIHIPYAEHRDILFESILQHITGSFIHSDEQSIVFTAERVSDVASISVNDIPQMIRDIDNQLQVLAQLGVGPCGFELSDIIQADNRFVFINAQYLFPIQHNQLFICEIIKAPLFSAPELMQLTKIPAFIPYHCVYYTLGSFVEYLLSVPFEFLYGSKIYWFIRRCKEERKLLFI